MLDLFFYYKNVIRFIFFLKKSKEKYNIIDIIEIKKAIVFFNIKNITALNSLSISNYFYFFKYFFGKVPFFSSYKHNFKLNVNYYSFLILYNFKKKDIYYILYFFINDVYYPITKSFVNIKKEDNTIEYIVNDMNFFIEKKNTIGFFYLKDSISFKFVLNDNLSFSLNHFAVYKI